LSLVEKNGKSETNLSLNYLITADYHTHTKHSDGTGSIEENVVAAIKKGLKKIAITDHGYHHIRIGMRKKELDKIRDEISRLNDLYPMIEILFGVEANLIGLNGEIDVPDSLLYKFDFVALGYHRAVVPKTLKDAWYLFMKNRLNSVSRNFDFELEQTNTFALINALKNNPVHFITHPGAKAQIDIGILAEHANKYEVALEINPRHDIYPLRHEDNSTIAAFRIALGKNAKFVINSDAHSPKKVGCFDNSLKVAAELNIPASQIINAEKL